MNIVVIGPGKTSLEVKIGPGETSLAFQTTFPHCYKKMSIVPDYWVSGDPNAYVEGFKFLLELEDHQKQNLPKFHRESGRNLQRTTAHLTCWR